jgi:hypothetical protein
MKTFETMIHIDTIKVFIKIVNDYMNTEAEGYRKKNIEENQGLAVDEIMNDMMSSISYIIGEYMAKCKKHTYSIIELFTKSYLFESVKLRQTFLREIIEYSRIADLKAEINKSLNLNASYIVRTIITDFCAGQTYNKLMVFASETIEFVNCSEGTDPREDWKLKDFKVEESLQIACNDIKEVIIFEVLNRILIRTDKSYYGLFFLQSSVSTLIPSSLDYYNPSIKYFLNVPIFNIAPIISEEEKNVFEAKEKEVQTMGETIKYYEMDEEVNDDIEEDNTDRPHREVILCSIVVKKVWDFFTNIFKSKSVQLLKDSKVVVIYEHRLIIYEDHPEAWANLEYRQIFKKKNRNDPNNYIKCCNYLTEYDLRDVLTLTAYEVDKIKVSFQGGGVLQIQVYDDYSFVKFKRALYPFLKQNNLNVKDDFYDEVN